MEYSFRNSPNDEVLSILLEEYDFILQKGSEKESIAYANIVSVRITRSGKVFKIHICSDGHRPIVISSRSFDNGKPVDKFREYALLVRVLHHHLKDKSKAVFSCGGDSDKFWQWIGLSAAFSFIISVIAEYWGLSLVNPYLQAFVLSALGVIVVIALNARNLPRNYSPTHIPLQFLP
ncbi:hypothetical protein BH10BAC4_BH10BAC4_00490 [soil metagenome]